MTILVTGAAGFVGAGIVRFLAGARPDEDVVAADLAPDRGALSLDVTDRDAVRRLIGDLRPDAIVHAAALTLTDPDDRSRLLDVNVTGTLNVLTAAAGAGTRRVIVASSSGVYAALPAERRFESDPLDAATPYAASKIAAEALAACHGAAAVRIGPVYGPGERPRPSRPRISTIGQLAAALAEARPVTLAGAEVTRDWTHVDDIGGGIDALLRAPILPHPVYNLSAGRAVPLSAVAAAFAVHGLDIRWTDAAEAEIALGPDDARPPLVIDRLSADTGFQPIHSIESGIAALVAAHASKERPWPR